MPSAARMGDNVMQDSPHCHATIHPPAPVPAPSAHPAMPLPIVMGSPTVTIGGMAAATVGSTTSPCSLVPCVPGGPGVISKGSTSVMIGGLPAARVGDMSAHASCVAPIPSPTGKILPPGCLTVQIN